MTVKVFELENHGFAEKAVIPAWILESIHRESVARVLKRCILQFFRNHALTILDIEFWHPYQNGECLA